MNLSPLPIQKFFDNNGNPLNGGLLFTYVAGTTTKVATYTDSTGGTTNTNPVVLDYRGEANVWLDPTLTYKFTLSPVGDTDPPTKPIWTVDQIASGITAAYLTQQIIGQILWPRTAAEIAAGVTPTKYYFQTLNPYRYGADGAGGASDATAYVAVNSVIAQIGTGVPTWLNGQAIPGYPKTPQEIAALVTPSNYTYTSDGQEVMNIFRFMTEAQIADIASGAGTLDVSAAIQAANNYLEGRAVGAIGTVNALVGGAAYNGGGSGTFFPVQLTGGAGQYAALSVVVSAGVITAATLIGPGQSFVIGNVLSITAANMIAAGAAAGGAGATITVATLATGGKTGSTITPGGKLIFPSGLYYCGTTGLRVGDMVNWEGMSISGTQMTWSNAFTGNAITLGPDMSGYNGRTGFYSMGNSIERFWLKLGNATAYGVYTTGLQQNGKIKDVWVSNVNVNGVFLFDNLGSANMLCEDVYVFGGTAMAATVTAFTINGGANCVLNRCSCNGGNLNLAVGIQFNGGEAKIRDFQCESTITHIDIAAAAGEGSIVVDKASLNLGAVGSLRGIRVRAGFTGTLLASAIGVGPFQVAIQNDNNGFARPSQAGGGIIPIYAWSGTGTDYSNIDNAVIGYHAGGNLTISGAGITITPDISTAESFLVNITNGAAFTIGKPTYGGTSFPGAANNGRRLRLQFYNQSGGAVGAITYNAVFKNAAAPPVMPANGFNRTYDWMFDGSTWYLMNPAADVTN